MPLISRKSIEEIRERVSIYDVISPYVNLKRSGSSWKGLSPFTNEKSPSFFVLPDKNIFKCFSSGNAGDLFRFLQMKENLSFSEAIESIAHRFNIELEYESGTGEGFKKETSLKKELLEIHELATYYFHKEFMANNQQGKEIRDFWINQRGFLLDLAEQLKIGFAPPFGNRLIEGLLKKGFSPEAIHQSGLFYAKDYERDPLRFKPRFRGRLIIPIRDIQGRPIGFAGRQLDITPQDDPARNAKYINSPETPIFSKGKLIFGLDHARTHLDESPYFILVEGQLDAIRCWERRFDTAIAPQGTSVTEQQLMLLRRYSSKLYCVLDGDEAGQKAALKVLQLGIKVGLEVKFIQMPEGGDPDSFLKNEGQQAFQSKIDNSIGAVEFALRYYLPKKLKPSPGEKSHAMEEIFKILENCDSSLLIEEYLQKAAQILRIQAQTIQEDFSNHKKRQFSVNRPKKSHIPQNKEKEKLTSAEYELLLICLEHEEIAQEISYLFHDEWLTEGSRYEKILLKIFAEHREELWPGTQNIDMVFETEKEKNLIYSLLAEKIQFENPRQIANLCLRTIFKLYINREKEDIELRIANCEKNDLNTIRELLQKRINLRNFLKNPPKIEEHALV